MTYRANSETSNDYELCELILVVRPEDKAAVARALESVVGAAYIIYHALGRGFDGGLSYGPVKRNWLGLVNRSHVLTFLPKIVFCAIVDRSLAESIMERVGAAVRLTGTPSECAGGFAVIAPIGQEISISDGRSGARAVAKCQTSITEISNSAGHFQ